MDDVSDSQFDSFSVNYHQCPYLNELTTIIIENSVPEQGAPARGLEGEDDHSAGECDPISNNDLWVLPGGIQWHLYYAIIHTLLHFRMLKEIISLKRKDKKLKTQYFLLE